jgi:glycosyltransferase involved in cell wall biosynthesis
VDLPTVVGDNPGVSPPPGSGTAPTPRTRVGFLLEFPTLLGGENSWLAALPHLKRIDPLAVAPAQGPLARSLAQLGIAHLPYGWPRGTPETRHADLASLLRDRGCEIVHANSLTTSLCAAALGESLHCPSIGHCRDIMRLSRARVQRLNRLDRLIAVSRAAAEALTDQGIRPEILRVIHNGIDAAATFDPARVPDSLHETLALPPTTPIVGFVGQLILRKDPLTFVRAVAQAQHRHPELHAVLIGARHSTKTEAVTYEAQVRSEAGPAVHFLGERADVAPLVRGMAAVICTSRQEPLSRVLLESLALARAVVATRVGGTEEIVTDEDNGLLVAADDVPATAAAITRLLTEPALTDRLGKRGRKVVLASFTPGRCAQAIATVYDEARANRDTTW